MDSVLVEYLAKIIETVPEDFGGGCGLKKAYVLSKLILEFRLNKSADIGVWRGRSMFPQAVAHKLVAAGGMVYGIDPWNRETAMENDTSLRDIIRNFNNATDFDEVYSSVITNMELLNLNDYCSIIRKSSSDAFNDLKNTELGLIHIDGNHDTKTVLKDVSLYSGILVRGGFIVLDDLSWASVQPAFIELCNTMNLVYLGPYAIFTNVECGRQSIQKQIETWAKEIA